MFKVRARTCDPPKNLQPRARHARSPPPPSTPVFMGGACGRGLALLIIELIAEQRWEQRSAELRAQGHGGEEPGHTAESCKFTTKHKTFGV